MRGHIILHADSLAPSRNGAPAVDTRWDRVAPDEGCRFSSSCLNCPLPRCRHEMEPGELTRTLRRLSDIKMLAIITDKQLTPAQAASYFGISKRTVFRILERTRKGEEQW